MFTKYELRKTIEVLGILQTGVNYIFETPNVGENPYGQIFSQPYFWQK